MAAYVDSYYRDTQRVSLSNTEPLHGTHRADVCVVGGGVTGSAAALHLAERGYRVKLLEAQRIGWGASGRSGGQIMPGFGTDLKVIANAVGTAGAQQAWEMSREAVRLTAELVERHDIPCDLKWGAVHAALKPRHLREFQAWQREMAEVYGYHGLHWLDREALHERVRSNAYIGGLHEPEAGHLHPLNYTLGVAAAAQRAGAEIHEGSAVTGLERGSPARVTTAEGRVDADFVVLAGNAYLGGDLEPALRGRIMPVSNYIIATEPLTEHQVANTLPYDDAVSDANFVLDYYRLSADRRLLYGGQVSYNGREPRRLRERMEAKLARVFPVLEGIHVTHRWGGRVGITLNRAPHFGRVGSNVYFAQGYSGQGMALAGLAGRLLAEAIGGQAERFDLLSRLRHQRFPGGERLRTPLLVLATNFYRMRDLI
ncbi:NAD(P)/FAD-dependent oxidoreductase [Arhodomonas sp. AD133]|uniref:NAD(P)/FAD-dependent oxidoreductase n=1 Tax=Arhodomonas sp. AD133 TaxID=3415009 RepID=UPI003EB7F02D